MGFGPFSTDKNTTNQSIYNEQVGVSGGGGGGGDTIGIGATHGPNIRQEKIKTGKGGTTTVTTNIQTLDPLAILANEHVSIAALESNQALSTLAVSYANTNAQTALETLQSLNSQHNIAEAGGSPAEIMGQPAPEGGFSFDNPKVIIGGIILLAIGAAAYYKLRS